MRHLAVPALLVITAANVAAFSPHALTASRRVARPLRGLCHGRKVLRVTCQAEGSTAPVLDVESTEAEPFLAFPGVPDKVCSRAFGLVHAALRPRPVSWFAASSVPKENANNARAIQHTRLHERAYTHTTRLALQPFRVYHGGRSRVFQVYRQRQTVGWYSASVKHI